jgi:hypothetical protein
LGHRCLHSSRPTDFNKRRETPSIAYWRISRSWVVLPYVYLNDRTSPEKPVPATWAHNPGKYETARSAAGRRKARKLGKQKQATALSFFVVCLAVFAYVPLVWHSEPSNSTRLKVDEVMSFRRKTLFFKCYRNQHGRFKVKSSY